MATDYVTGEEYRRIKGALQCLDLGASSRDAYISHAMLCPARYAELEKANSVCNCGYTDIEAIMRECSACPNGAYEDGLCDPCHGIK